MNATAVDIDLAEGTWSLSSSLSTELSTLNTGNVVFSPFSLAAVLLMVRLGARGKTGQEIDEVLRLPTTGSNNYDALVQGINHTLRLLQEPSDDLNLTTANRLYTRSQLKLHPQFRKNLWQAFHVTARGLNFTSSVKAATKINKWVQYATKGKIDKLIQADSLGPSTSMILLNGVYFKGSWEHGFHTQLTRKESFYVNKNEKVAVEMMRTAGPFLYGEFEEMDAKVVVLPYKGNQLSMIIYVPVSVNGLSEVQEWLQTLELTEIFQRFTQGSQVEVSLPKFKVESTFELVQPLKSVGLKTMFSSAADFSGMTLSGRRKPFVSSVIQKAFIEVTEEGTEAAAATAMVLSRRSMVSTDFQLKANRPFCYQVVDHRTNLVIFNGVVRNPKDQP